MEKMDQCKNSLEDLSRYDTSAEGEAFLGSANVSASWLFLALPCNADTLSVTLTAVKFL
jgi:hypothetical protein